MLKISILAWALAAAAFCHGQRSYKPASVLASGNWFKVAVDAPGVYRVDLPFLEKLGMDVPDIPSASLRLFGNGGQMLSEDCSRPVIDDLAENAIAVYDGGDGRFNGTDYFLFYAPGPHRWLKDSVSRTFSHQKNLFCDQAFYFVTLGDSGMRVQTTETDLLPAQDVTSFDERFYHELDTFNFLKSGKEWFGEEFASGGGRKTNQTFIVPLQHFLHNTQATLVSSCISRSIGAASQFRVKVGDHTVLEHHIPEVSASGFDRFAGESQETKQFSISGDSLLTYDYQPGNNNAQGWLNWFELLGRRELDVGNDAQMQFRDWTSVGAAAAKFRFKNPPPGMEVWDITDPLHPSRMLTEAEHGELAFVNECSILREYVAFRDSGFPVPVPLGKIANQNLHQAAPADMIIVTDAVLMEQADRLASHHAAKDGMRVTVVTAASIYNEFGSASPDPTAIRDFLKMYHDRFRSDPATRLKYLLLFGDASYDYKDRVPGNTNPVPTYESPSSLDPLSTFTSDDYFGFLDDHDSINAAESLLDIGIGRVPARSVTEARNFVDKLIRYSTSSALGPWRIQTSFVADDEDFNLHLHDMESITQGAAAANPSLLQEKIYLDAYRQESNSSGSRYPDVNKLINERLRQGALIWNYTGHGNYRRLAEEVVLDQDIVSSWTNRDRLPLFITATCDFAPYDNPQTESLGENILLREGTGAIALMTTTRLVFAFSNRVLNRNYLSTALQQRSDGTYRTLGEAVQDAKNAGASDPREAINNRKFVLLGDPALTLAFPRYKIVTDSINGKSVSGPTDTLKALQHYTISASVREQAGSILADFNGEVSAFIYDKPRTLVTRANDPGSAAEAFQVQDKVLIKARSRIGNGRFTFDFVVPKDITYPFGNGSIFYYAEDGRNDANGSFNGLLIGGSEGVHSDEEGPHMRGFFNDSSFVDGGITDESPLLIVELADSSGINVVNTGIGHEMTAVLDDDHASGFILNDFYTPELNSFTRGTISFRMPKLSEGKHVLHIKAWDAANNSTVISIAFRVRKNVSIAVSGFRNYPNPFTGKTTFRFDHDLDNEPAIATVSIYTLSGQLVKTLQRTINQASDRSQEIEWDGKSDLGVILHEGVYISRLRLKTPGGRRAERASRILILK